MPSRARYGIAIPVEVGLYLALTMFGLLLWWTSRYRASLVPMFGPWEFSWTWFFGTSAALWWYARGLFATPSPQRPPVWRSLLYFVGVVAIYAVLQTRFEYFAQHMFFLNRIQALILHDFGPILIAISWPAAVLARGMPDFAKHVMHFLATSHLVQPFRQPAIVAAILVTVMVLWLIPTVHFRAMIDPTLYQVMNWSMMLDGLLFWLIVLDPRPRCPASVSYRARVLMMVAVMIPQIIIGAGIALSTRNLYGFYDWCGRIYPSIGAMQDQQLGGLIISTPPLMMNLMALIVVIYRLVQGKQQQHQGDHLMHMNTVRLLFASFALVPAIMVLPVAAGNNDLALSNAYVQVTIPSRPAAGYFTLKNNGDMERVLVRASSPGCGSVMLHKSESVNGVETMREVDSITVPAHGSVEFTPGGFHLMCMSPADALKPGTTTQVTLSFKDGDALTSDFPVRSVTGN